MSTQLYQLQMDGTWKRPVALIAPVGEWIYGPLGSYFPGPTTSGLPPGVVPALYPATGGPFGSISGSGRVTLSGVGTVVDGWDFPAGLTVSGQNITVQNCRIRGKVGAPTGPLVVCYGSTVVNLTVQDCEIIPDEPGRGTDGITGHHYTAKRNKIQHCTDSFGVFNTASPSGQHSVYIYANYAGDHAYFSPDPAHPGDTPISHTHNDALQVQSGNLIRVIGNTLLGLIDPAVGQASFSSASPDPASTPPGGYNVNYPVMNGNSALQVTQGVGPVFDLWLNNNFIDGGGYAVNVGPGSYPNFGQIKDNTFGSKMIWRYISVPNAAPCTISGNVKEDGTPVPVVRY